MFTIDFVLLVLKYTKFNCLCYRAKNSVFTVIEVPPFKPSRNNIFQYLQDGFMEYRT